jgi:hypothetical protein
LIVEKVINALRGHTHSKEIDAFRRHATENVLPDASAARFRENEGRFLKRAPASSQSGILTTIAELMATRRNKHALAKRLEVSGRVFQPLFFLTALAMFIFFYA